MTSAPKMQRDPGAVAWRVKDFADGWFYYGQAQWVEADRAEHDGFLVQPLYLAAPDQVLAAFETLDNTVAGERTMLVNAAAYEALRAAVRQAVAQ